MIKSINLLKQEQCSERRAASLDLRKQIQRVLSKKWFSLNEENRMILQLAVDGLDDLYDYESISTPCHLQIIQRVQKAAKIIEGSLS